MEENAKEPTEVIQPLVVAVELQLEKPVNLRNSNCCSTARKTADDYCSKENTVIEAEPFVAV